MKPGFRLLSLYHSLPESCDQRAFNGVRYLYLRLQLVWTWTALFHACSVGYRSDSP